VSGFFGRKQSTPAVPQFDEAAAQEYDLQKVAGLERVLGPMADIVGHSIIPFQVGGAVDMYYFPNALPGTAFATMEIVEPGGFGPKIGPLGPYELIGFTKLPFSELETPAFKSITSRMNVIMTSIGNYSRQAVLRPLETVELPGRTPEDSNCLVLDAYRNPDADFIVASQPYGLLMCVEVFRSEMEFAMHNGTGALISRLREAGHYPYSDLDRQAVA
jgi:hypothetical protein